VELHQSNDLIHGVRHGDIVYGYAKDLLFIHGDKADLPIVMASAYLHDIRLGGENPSSEVERRVNSAGNAGAFLESIGWDDVDIGRVQGAILQHDQSLLSPTTLEGKILKDADFMAGFGSEGIIRVIVKMVENGKNVGDVIKTLEEKVPKRIQGLEFKESKEVSKAKWQLTSDFLQDLKYGLLTVKGARKKLNDRDADRADLIM